MVDFLDKMLKNQSSEKHESPRIICRGMCPLKTLFVVQVKKILETIHLR